MKLRLLSLFFITAACAAGLSAAAEAQDTDLTVEVSGLRNYKGRVVLVLWPASAEISKFPDTSRVQYRDERAGDLVCDFPNAAVCRRVIESIQNLAVSYTFRSVPPGDYAVFVFHDENNNGILDTGFMKRPLEARGFSGVLPDEVSVMADKIRFDHARIALNGPRTITIGLRYPPRL